LSKFNFLVTGGAGFIGSNIVEYLLKNGARKVVILDNFSNGHRKNIESFLKDDRCKLVEGDIRDRNVCEQVMDGTNIVFHQAALGSVPRSINDPITTNEVNINGFLNIIDIAKNTKSVERV